jgi:NitT/TauT family transport system permease protein
LACHLVTLKNTWWGFLFGSASGIAAGLILGRSDLLARILGPYIVALNSIPRIALVPLIILMFGLGDMSKIATAWIVVFFVVFFNTFEGTRAVDRDQIAAARLLGAREWASLRLSPGYSLR